MWKYTHTDEMYHSLTNRNNSTELFHSDVYLGQEYSDGLKHYKYLKKVKSANGKWRYIYDETELKVNEAISKNVINKSRSNEGYEFKDSTGATNIHKIKGNGILTSGSHVKISSAFTKPENQTKVDKIKEKQFNVYQNHYKQKVKDIPKRIVAKGAGIVGKALLEMDKKIAKKKVEKKVKTAVKNVENKANEVKNKVENSLKKKKKKSVPRTYLVNK